MSWMCIRACRSVARGRRFESGVAGRARLSWEGALQIDVGERELVLPGKARGHGELDPPDATPDQGADLQQLQADGATGGIGELGVAQRDPAQLVEQHVSHRGEPQAQLVGRRRASHSPMRGSTALRSATWRPTMRRS